MDNTVTLNKILPLVQQLSLVERVRLMALLTPQIERDLREVQLAPRKSLRGLWRELDVTESDIEAAREEMWCGFPRKDV